MTTGHHLFGFFIWNKILFLSHENFNGDMLHRDLFANQGSQVLSGLLEIILRTIAMKEDAWRQLCSNKAEIDKLYHGKNKYIIKYMTSAWKLFRTAQFFFLHVLSWLKCNHVLICVYVCEYSPLLQTPSLNRFFKQIFIMSIYGSPLCKTATSLEVFPFNYLTLVKRKGWYS